MYYVVTVGFEPEAEEGKRAPRQQKEKYLLDAESVEEVTVIAAKYIAGDMRSSEVLSIIQMPIKAVLTPKLTPEYYK